jgi:MFS family permease
MDAATPSVPGRRWPIISALGVVQIFAWGSSYYLLAVLAEPIAADTGWPLPWIIGALSLGMILAGLASPHIGKSIGRRGGRDVLATGSVLIALGLVALGSAPTLPVFMGGWVLLGLGMGASLYDAAFATLGKLFGSSARPSIAALTLWGGFASTVCWPLSALLVEQVGWRGACLAYAAIQAGVSLPLILTLIPRQAKAQPPAQPGPRREAESPSAQEFGAMVLLGLIVVLAGTITVVVSVQLLALLQARGLTLAAAVSLGALIGPAQVGARIVEIAGRSRHHPMWTLTAAMTLMALGLVALGAGAPVVAVALICYGAGNGVFSIARGTLPLALFGPERYAALMGRIAMPSLIVQALAPSLAAFIMLRWGADALLWTLVACATTNVVLMGLLWRTAAVRR